VAIIFVLKMEGYSLGFRTSDEVNQRFDMEDSIMFLLVTEMWLMVITLELLQHMRYFYT